MRCGRNLHSVVGLSFCLASLTFASGLTNPEKEGDLVTDLPGVTFTPGFSHYSGYLHAGGSRWIHYWLVESESAPQRAPLVLWLNGGPGCSSLEGMLTENGPFLVNSDGRTLRENPYSWNKIANMLYIESPVGAGFSYTENDNYTVNDDMTAEQNHLALRSFMQRFPEYRQRQFYITGESYAGVYIPTLMVRIKDDPLFNFKGAAIGNAVINNLLMSVSKMSYYYAHGLLGTQDWNALTKACCSDQVCDFIPFPSNECQQQVASATIKVLSEPINPYNIYTDCHVSGSVTPQYNTQRRLANIISFTFKMLTSQFDDPKAVGDFIAASEKLASSVPCSDSAPAETYLGSLRVRKALHIRSRSAVWRTCSTMLDAYYIAQYSDTRPFIQKVMDDKKYRLLFYNGDLDTVCDFFADEAAIEGMHLAEARVRQPWYFTDAKGLNQIGGFVHEYDKLAFMTIKGSGHMVPTDQPVASYTMFKRFLEGDNY